MRTAIAPTGHVVAAGAPLTFQGMKISSALRLRSVGLATALTAAGLLAVPSTAHAAVLNTPVTQTSVDFSGAGGCTASGPGDATTAAAFAADGVPVTTTSSSSATYTHNVDNTDVTTLTGSVTSTVTATQAAGALRTLDLESTAQVSVQASKGTAQACSSSVTASGVTVATFDLPTAKYVTVQVNSRNSVGVVVLQNSAGISGGVTQNVNFFIHSHLTQRLYLPVGNWILQLQGQSVLQAPTASVTMPSPASGRVAISMLFDDPGVATGKAEGGGSKYLDLAAGRTCAAGTLTGTWKAKAGKGDNRKVKKAVFRVDGAKVKTVKKPKKKQKTTLTGLDPNELATVSVTLTLVEKGAEKTSVERTYLPCT